MPLHLNYLQLIQPIQKNAQKFRTIGLYLLILTFGKIIFYDIWFGVDSGMVRVIALILVGAMTIGLSMLYNRKYQDNLLEELSIKNLAKEKK